MTGTPCQTGSATSGVYIFRQFELFCSNKFIKPAIFTHYPLSSYHLHSNDTPDCAREFRCEAPSRCARHVARPLAKRASGEKAECIIKSREKNEEPNSNGEGDGKRHKFISGTEEMLRKQDTKGCPGTTQLISLLMGTALYVTFMAMPPDLGQIIVSPLPNERYSTFRFLFQLE